jgi:hypothetical protein
VWDIAVAQIELESGYVTSAFGGRYLADDWDRQADAIISPSVSPNVVRPPRSPARPCKATAVAPGNPSLWEWRCVEECRSRRNDLPHQRWSAAAERSAKLPGPPATTLKLGKPGWRPGQLQPLVSACLTALTATLSRYDPGPRADRELWRYLHLAYTHDCLGSGNPNARFESPRRIEEEK